jgi:hypothetical protein
VDARWIPVFAAIVGVLGGIGGAYIGGSLANRGQQQEFKNERKAAIEDVRRATYANYLQVADDLVTQLQVARGDLAPEKVVPLVRAAAAVDILAHNADVRDAADDLRQAVADGNIDQYDALRNRFIKVAHHEIAETSE